MPDGRAVEVAAQHQARLPGAPLAAAHERLALGEPPRDAEHQREREVGGRLGEHVRGVADRDAARRGRLHVHVVHADRVVRDRAQARRGVDQLGVDRVGEQRQQPLELAARARAARRAAAAGARARPPRRARPRGARAPRRAAGGLRTRGLGTHWGEEHGRNGGVREDAGEPARAATAVALVANERSGSSDPALRGAAGRRSAPRSGASASRSSRRAVASGADRVVVAGGDGSIAPVAAAAGAAGIPLAVVPAGTANDFARRLGLPDDLPGGLPARRARHAHARARARLDERRAPVRERRERRASRAGRRAGAVVEAAAGPAGLRGRRARRGPHREAAHVPRGLRRARAARRRGVAGHRGGVGRLRRRRGRRGGRPRATARSRWWRSRPGRASAWSGSRTACGAAGSRPPARVPRALQEAEVQVPDGTPSTWTASS